MERNKNQSYILRMIAVLERSLDKPMNTEMAEETLRAIQLLKDKLKK
jgi:hypothetical protein